MTDTDLYNIWLDTQQQGNVGREIGALPEYPAYGLSANDSMKYISALTPWDLWMKDKVDPRKYIFDYPTSAMNISEPIPLSSKASPKPEIAAFITEPNNKYAPLYVSNPWSRPPIYAHELGHYNDMRPNPYEMWSFPNHGLLTWNGLSGGLLQREFPAMVAEEGFRRR